MTGETTVLVGKPGGKILFERHRDRPKEKMKINLRETECDDIWPVLCDPLNISTLNKPTNINLLSQLFSR